MVKEERKLGIYCAALVSIWYVCLYGACVV